MYPMMLPTPYTTLSYCHLEPVSQKILSPLAIVSKEQTMVAKVIRELKSIPGLKIFPETDHWSHLTQGALPISYTPLPYSLTWSSLTQNILPTLKTLPLLPHPLTSNPEYPTYPKTTLPYSLIRCYPTKSTLLTAKSVALLPHTVPSKPEYPTYP